MDCMQDLNNNWPWAGTSNEKGRNFRGRQLTEALSTMLQDFDFKYLKT